MKSKSIVKLSTHHRFVDAQGAFEGGLPVIHPSNPLPNLPPWLFIPWRFNYLLYSVSWFISSFPK